MARVDLMRCPDCDKPIATDEDDRVIPEGQGEHLCWRSWNGLADGCCMEPHVDWRARCLAMLKIVDASVAMREADADVVGSDEMPIAELTPLADRARRRTAVAIMRWRNAVDAYRASKGKP